MRTRAWVGVALTLCTTAAFAKGDVSDKPQCRAGKLQCVHHVVTEMNQRLRSLSKSCDHDAIFALAYLRTTDKYGETAESIDYEDVNSVTREDARFADYYFHAYDAYHSGHGSVPPAWQIAFDASAAHAVNSVGNAFLGFNAHIQRDLPFALFELYQDGTPLSEFDHYKVNEFLSQVDFSQEIVDRFDPTFPLGGDPSLIFEWRDIAWQNYIALRDAPNQTARAAVAAAIEEYAAYYAQLYVQATAYPPGTDSSERDAYCEENASPHHSCN